MFKDSAFTAVKVMQSSKLRMRKGYHLSMEGILTKEVPSAFSVKKWYIKGRVGVGPQGRSLPV